MNEGYTIARINDMEEPGLKAARVYEHEHGEMNY